MKYQIGFAMQILGLLAVGVCLINGLLSGDYTKVGLYQFVGGSIIFYFGHFLRIKSS